MKTHKKRDQQKGLPTPTTTRTAFQTTFTFDTTKYTLEATLGSAVCVGTREKRE